MQDEQHYRYDALGRLSFRSAGQGGTSPIIANTYDPAGRLIASQHGDSAHRYPVDAAGNRLEGTATAQSDNRITQLDGARYHHDGAGNLIEREQQNGDRLSLGYDAANRLVQLTRTSPQGTTQEASYRYDALGRLSFRSVGQGGTSPIIAYTYDPAGRLIASQHGDSAHRYPVDAAGNRLEGTATAQSDNRITQLDGARYRNDGAGNLIEREQQNGDRLSLGYDGANRLVQLTRTSPQGDTQEASYRYDALGRRIAKTVRHANGTTATTHYGWDGDRLVHEAKGVGVRAISP